VDFFPSRLIKSFLKKDVETAHRMNRQGCPNGDEGPKENRAQACDTKTTQPEQKTDREGWLKLVGFDAFMDLKNREDRSLMALERDNDRVPQHLNSVVIRMLGFPTSSERLLEWLRAKFGEDFESMEIKQLKQEKTLFLNGFRKNNKLTSLPKEIWDLKQLEELFLEGNKLTSLPKEIGDLKQLKELHLRNNQLKSLPKEIGDLKQLKKLYLRGNNLASLPKEIGDLKQLKKLSLIGNQLTSLPKEIGDLGENGVQIEGLFDSSNNGGFGDGGSGFERN